MKKNSTLRFSIAFALLFLLSLPAFAQTVFEDGFEAAGSWFASNGLWERGTPDGQPAPFAGDNVYGTVLNGNYPNYADTRLISPQIALPPVSGEELIKLKFFHWYSMSSGDKGELHLSTDNGATWVKISGIFDGVSNVWTQYYADLTAYQGQSIRLGFYFYSDYNSSTVSSGWFIDEVSIFKALVVCDSLEGFENGYQDWYADNGLWQVGIPQNNPVPYAGSQLAGTVLNGNYPNYANTRLISPSFNVPENTLLELKFRHWFSFSSGDQGTIQITRNGSDWQTVAVPFDGSSGGWTQSIFLLDGVVQAGDTIQLGFYFASDYNSSTVSSGWFIDEIELWCSSSSGTAEICGNGTDDDGDNLIDCDDSDCTPVISSVTTQDPTPPDYDNGQITINTSATFLELEYSIDGGGSYQASNVFTGLPAGSYDIRARNANSVLCSSGYAGGLVVLEEDSGGPCPDMAIVSVETDYPGAPDYDDGQITILADGDNLEYSINDGQAYQPDNVFAGLSSGSYYIRIRDALSNDCTESFANNPVVFPDGPELCAQPAFSWSAPPDSVCANSPIRLCIAQSDVNFTYELIQNGFFTGTVIDGNGEDICFEDIQIAEATTFSIGARQKLDPNCFLVIPSSNLTIEIGTLGFSYDTKDETTFGNDGRIDICVNTGTPPFALDYAPERGLYDFVPLPCLGSIEISGLRAGFYQVAIEDAEGCTATKIIPVENPDKARIGFPEKPILTPNGDGMNDRLVFEGILINTGESELIIYDRFGSVIFRGPAETYDDLWDATWNGSPVPAGTYFYSLRVFIPEEKVFNGFITVAR